MAQTSQPEQGNLNELLEDALSDLLLDDSNEVSEQFEAHKVEKNEQKEVKSQKKTKAKPKQKSSEPNDLSNEPSTSTKVIDEAEMDRFFASMTEKLKEGMPKIDPEEAQARINESVPQIFDLMQNLLSKELLYPALKDLAPKFDEYLQKNIATLSKDDRRRYKKQISKIHEIIDVFDDESLDNQERFEKNLELMEQMQALGAPPEELTVPEGMSRCSIM